MITTNYERIKFPFVDLEKKYLEKIESAVNWLRIKYENNELGFIDLDKLNFWWQIQKIKDFVSKSKKKYDDVVVLGIWWSALWTKAVLTAIKWKYYNELSREKRNDFSRLHVLDNIDPIEIYDLKNVINLEKTLFIVISKSGSTIETISQFKYFKWEIEKLYSENRIISSEWDDSKWQFDYRNHFVVIAWENSDFKKKCLSYWLNVFDIPENVWWRFSVLTNVWLLPLAFAWIEIEKLFASFWDLKKYLFEKDLEKNLALKLALFQYYFYTEENKNITIFFPYISNLVYFSDWYKQLFAESIWKDWLWITLVDAIWATDQHSQLQLYNDWPNDKLLIFLWLENFPNDFNIEESMTFSYLLNTERKWTEESLTKKWIPNLTINIDNLNEKTVWELILFFELQVAYLWELLGINAYNQPWVEESKKIIKELIFKDFWSTWIFNWNFD